MELNHAQIGGMSAKATITETSLMTATPTSEYERETQALEANLSYLEARLSDLHKRLLPVRTQEESEMSSSGQKELSPLSLLGAQLRGYSNRIDSLSNAVNSVLDQLVLP